MISIVICSINPAYLSQVKENISSTIGVKYEMLTWDNSQENKGICEVYNIMAKKARYDIICFAHEDILFQTMNWGHKVNSIFSERDDIGVFGLAGSKYKSGCFSGWYTGIKEFDCANVLHRYNWGDEYMYLRPSEERSLEDVVCIDGVFICCRKKIWEIILFDQKNLPGFHFYDIDFSVRAATVCTVAVSFDILLAHITKGGDFGDSWVETAIVYHKFRQALLPVSTVEQLSANTDKRIIQTWLDLLKNYSISWRNKWRWLSKQGLLSQPSFFYSIGKFLFYKPLGLRHIHKSRKHK
ncbi:MAG: glycosyltransferase [Bacteroidota bacterium]